MHIQIKWQGHLSQNISVQCGTKQGGLCSTFIFNLFYQNLVDTLQKAKCGVRIGSNNYNCFCYADDILVCSTTVTGLQYLINTATEYVQKHGLNFNSNKTSCMIMGGNPFTSLPQWNIDGQPLQIVKNLRYLGTDFGDLSGTAHCSNRNTASTRAFYGLMRAGIKYPELDSNIVVNIFRSTVQSVTQFGCHSVFVSKRNMLELNKLQGKFVKKCFNLGNWCHTQPLLKAMKVLPLSHCIHLGTLDLVKSCIISSSLTKKFYCEMSLLSNSNYTTKTLVGRATSIASNNDIDLMKYVFCENYSTSVKRKFCKQYKIKCGQNGFIDSVRSLISNANIRFLEILLKAF